MKIGITLPVQQWLDDDDALHEEALRLKINDAIDQMMKEKQDKVGEDAMRHFEKA